MCKKSLSKKSTIVASAFTIQYLALSFKLVLLLFQVFIHGHKISKFLVNTIKATLNDFKQYFELRA